MIFDLNDSVLSDSFNDSPCYNKLYTSTLVRSFGHKIDTRIRNLLNFEKSMRGDIESPIPKDVSVVENIVFEKFKGNLRSEKSFRTSNSSSGVFSAESSFAISGESSVGTLDISQVVSERFQSDYGYTSCKKYVSNEEICSIYSGHGDYSDNPDFNIENNNEISADPDYCEITDYNSVESSSIMENSRMIDKANVENFRLDQVEYEKKLLIAMEKSRKSLHNFPGDGENLLPVGTVVINNLRLINHQRQKKSQTVYFICLLSCGSDFYASEMIAAGKYGDIVDIPGPFHFNHLKSDFVINVKVFTAAVKRKRRGWFCWPIKRKSREEKCLKNGFQFCGETNLTIDNLKNVNHSLIIKPDEPSELLISTSIETSVTDVETNTIGYIDIARNENHPITWSSRWCVLDGTNLMLWNHPVEVQQGAPLKIIDLSKFKLMVRSQLRQWALELDLNPGRVLLAFNSESEMLYWKMHLDIIARINGDWASFR